MATSIVSFEGTTQHDQEKGNQVFLLHVLSNLLLGELPLEGVRKCDQLKLLSLWLAPPISMWGALFLLKSIIMLFLPGLVWPLLDEPQPCMSILLVKSALHRHSNKLLSINCIG